MVSFELVRKLTLLGRNVLGEYNVRAKDLVAFEVETTISFKRAVEMYGRTQRVFGVVLNGNGWTLVMGLDQNIEMLDAGRCGIEQF